MKIYQKTIGEPKQWRAGYVGKGFKPFYFDCCSCHAKEPEIAGFLSSTEESDLHNILVSPGVPCDLALFCKDCWNDASISGWLELTATIA